ncbi:hypothetical protein [Caulobacter sp.]|uniref:hypothetical protein n=1 Tax=Caulobacter sp. TaxID=78 RepID=UPI003BABC523
MLKPDVRPMTELEALHPLAYFGVMHRVMTIIAGGRRAQALRNQIAKHSGGDPSPPQASQLEFLCSSDRHRISGLAARLMRGWPWMFIGLCADARIWKSWALRDQRKGCSPFAYEDTVIRYLSGMPEPGTVGSSAPLLGS